MENSLYIHCGTHKTGSTSIQSYLRANTEQIESSGFKFVFVQSYSVNASNYDLHQSTCISQRLDLDSLRADVVSALISHSVILSYEGFSGSLHLGYRDSCQCATIVSNLFTGIDTTILLFLRHPLHFFESAYCQAIKEGDSIDSDTYLKRFGSPFEAILAVYDSYRRTFGEDSIRLCNYDESCTKEYGIIGCLLKELSIFDVHDIPAGFHTYKYNAGYSRLAIELARNSHSFESTSLCHTTMRKYFNSADIAIKKYPGYLLSPSDYEQLMHEIKVFVESDQSSSVLSHLSRFWLSSFETVGSYSIKHEAMETSKICLKRLSSLVRQSCNEEMEILEKLCRIIESHH